MAYRSDEDFKFGIIDCYILLLIIKPLRFYIRKKYWEKENKKKRRHRERRKKQFSIFVFSRVY